MIIINIFLEITPCLKKVIEVFLNYLKYLKYLNYLKYLKYNINSIVSNYKYGKIFYFISLEKW